MTADWTHDEVAQTRKEVWQKGLQARFRGQPILPFAEKLLTIAEGGLERRGYMTPSGQSDERVHLTRLKELVAAGQTPADKLVEGLDHVGDPRAEILARTDLGAGT